MNELKKIVTNSEGGATAATFNGNKEVIKEVQKILKDNGKEDKDPNTVDDTDISNLEDIAATKAKGTKLEGKVEKDKKLSTDEVEALDLEKKTEEKAVTPVAEARVLELVNNMREGKWVISKDGTIVGDEASKPKDEAETKAVLEYLAKRANLVADLYPDWKIEKLDPSKASALDIVKKYDEITNQAWFDKTGKIVFEKGQSGAVGPRKTFVSDSLIRTKEAEIAKFEEAKKVEAENLLKEAKANFQTLVAAVGAKNLSKPDDSNLKKTEETEEDSKTKQNEEESNRSTISTGKVKYIDVAKSVINARVTPDIDTNYNYLGKNQLSSGEDAYTYMSKSEPFTGDPKSQYLKVVVVPGTNKYKFTFTDKDGNLDFNGWREGTFEVKAGKIKII